MTETIPLYVITGATRCGKSTTAAWIEKHKAAGERVRVIHQDRYYKESSAMPKVSLQGAPYVRVSFWDSADSVDWTEFFTVVNAAINEQGPSRPTMVIVEGNQLVMPTLVKMATEIVCIGLDKWVCFERRLAGDDSRQCYLPYMIEMWREHVARFERFLASAPGDKVNFITQAQLKYLCAQPDKPSSASDAFEILTDACSSSSRDFKRTIENDTPYPPSWVPIDVTRDESFFGARLAPLVNGAQPIDSFKRLYGALIGNALGDASGAWCEFHHQKPVVWADGKLTIPLVLTGRGGVRAAPPGAITDDFQMTLLALKCLVKNNMRFVPDDHVSAYVRWASAHPGGIGTNTRALFQHSHTKNFDLSLEKYNKAHRERHADKDKLSMSNGTLMRAAAFAANSDNTAAIKAAIADAALSNDNPVSKFANAVYVAVLSEMVHANVDGTFIDQINTAFFNNLHHRCFDGDVSVAAAVKLVGDVVLDAVHANVPAGNMSALVNDKDKKGYVLVALWVAFRYLKVHISRRQTFGETIRQVVVLGGDTDTNAAITGALLGAHIGITTLRRTERDNLTVLMNVQYRYATVKNIDNLNPAALAATMYKLRTLDNNNDTDEPAEESSSTSNNKQKRTDDDDDESREEKIAKLTE